MYLGVSPAVWICTLWIAFIATHLGLASARVEPRLRTVLGEGGFLGLYSLVSLAVFVPLVRFYLGHRHAGAWLWFAAVGPALRMALYCAIALAFVLVAASLLRPSPASVVPGEARVHGVYRITRHPLVLGLAIVWALHLIPNGNTADIAFFGGFLLFSLLGAWHQDARKLHAERARERAPTGAMSFAEFRAATPFLPFTGRDSLRGLREIPPLAWAIGLGSALAIRWLHGSIWPH